ncbi:tRNA pseudouridine synthase D [Marinobacter litoralis]|uniref:tRNA pseudouridine synthase D n=1 Tax=Marinobacter litoralis TaxID=187981 RepID=A0A3M2RA40_9GAMM|nr:tRNA pseudouridine(13) synthase TruD [Marinobacter litoralis]RMJ02152.1 tRNA pseudouridine synthase D [Marinobacter litoralis]
MTQSKEGKARWRLDWPTSSGIRPASALLKASPEDFRVTEYLGPEFEGAQAGDKGAGEHLCVRLEKTGDNTEYVASELAILADTKTFEVGFCGLKDRHAVTVQWFSLYRPGMESEDAELLSAIARRWPVLAHRRHARKLRRGEHEHNGFELVLREVSGDRSQIDAALNLLAERGAPNYFGPQRFGLAGGNLDKAVTLDPTRLNRKRGGRRGGGGRASKNVLYFSAARSWLFNEVLAERVSAGNWFAQLPGEPSENGESTGPLWGDGGTQATGEQEKLERSVIARHPEFERLFSSTRMKPERRALVTQPIQLRWDWVEDNTLRLHFLLPPGQYATTVLGDLFELQDMSLSRDNK